MMESKTLAQIVAEQPFTEFRQWWPMGPQFLGFMSEAIVSEWQALPHQNGDLALVSAYTAEYLKTVFDREARAGLVEDFVNKPGDRPIASGEFDALSYAFYRAAFELIAQYIANDDKPLAPERRRFTKRVGKIFFARAHSHLNLELPPGLANVQQFAQLKTGIETVGQFLLTQGYLRDHFSFPFAVNIDHAGRSIQQTEAAFLTNLHQKGIAHALYEMGYPVILPSAVYLFHTIGEAQHHSSRTIEELFERVGYQARETDDFDPIDYPSDRVVELWEIKKLSD